MNETVLKLSPEEHFELRQALEANIKREQAAVESMRKFAVMNAPGGVIERAQHSINILTVLLRKLP